MLTPYGATYRLGGGGGVLTMATVLSGPGNGLAVAAGTVVLAGSDTYGGATTISGGSVQLANQAGIPDNNALALSGGTLDLGGFNKAFTQTANFGNAAGTIVNSGSTAGIISLTASGASMTIASLVQDGASPAGFSVTSLGGSSGYNFDFTNPGNTFSGGVTVNNASARMLGTGANTAMGTGTITISNSGFLMIWANTGSFAGSVTVANNFVLNTVGGDQIAAQLGGSATGAPGEKTAIFTDGNTGGSPLTYLTGTITLASSGGIDAYSSDALTVSGSITGPGTLVKGILDFAAGATQNGGGVVTLANTANNYQGGTVVNFGTLKQGASGVIPYGPGAGDLTVNSSTLGSGTLDLAGYNAPLNGLWGNGTVTNSATSGSNLLTVGNNNATSTFAGVIQNPSGSTISLSKSGSGNLTLTGANTFTGATTNNGGTLTLGASNALATSMLTYNGTGSVAFAGGIGTFTLGGLAGSNPTNTLTLSDVAAGNVTLSVGANNANSTYSGLLAGGGGLTKVGSGTLTLNSAAAYAYSGATTLSAGTLAVTNGLALQNSTLTMSGGNLAIAGPTALTVGGLAGSTNLNLQNTASQAVGLSVGANNANTSYTGVLTGGSGLTKVGGGTFTLAAPQNYSGPTVVAAGTLLLGTALPAGVAAHYTFEGNANDASGNGNNGTLVGSPTFTTGKFGQALSLAGAGQYVTVPYSSSLNLTGAYTVSTWVNIASQPAVAGGSGPGLISTRNGGDGTFDVQYDQSSAGVYGLHADIGNGSGWISTGANYTLPGPLTGWNMITYAVNSTSYTIYVNGVQVTSVGMSGTPEFMKPGETLSLGSQEGGGAAYGAAGWLNGAMDDTAVFGSAPSAAQVRSLYLGGAGQLALPPTTPLQVAAGATLDLGGVSQQVASLSDYASGSGTVTNSGVYLATLTIGDSTSTTFSGLIQDGANPSALAKVGAGTLTLANNNTYTGGTTVAAGQLLLNAGNNTLAPAGGITVSGGTLNLGGYSQNATSGIISFQGGTVTGGTISNSGSPYDAQSGAVAAVLGGSAGLSKTTSGTVTLANNNTYSGVTTVAAGRLTLAGGNDTLSPTGPITTTGGTLDLGGFVQDTSGLVSFQGGTVSGGTINNTGSAYDAQAGSVSAALAGNVALVKSNSGVFLLTNSGNAYSGGTQINAGTLSFANGALPGSITFGGGALQWVTGNTQDVSAQVQPIPNGVTAGFDTQGNVVTLAAAPLTGGGGLAKIGAGLLVLGGSNTYGGTTTVSAGTLQVGSGGGSGSLGPGNVVNNASLVFNRTDGYGGAVAASISGTGSLTLSAGNLTLAGGNSYTGTTAINAGVLSLANSAALAGGGTVTFGGGTLQYSAANTQDYSGNIVSSNGPVSIDTNGQSVAFNSGLANSNSGGLTKLGAGVLVLGGTGAYAYGGATTISGGTLQMGVFTPTVQNGGFESPAIAANSFMYYSGLSAGQQASFVWSSSGNPGAGGAGTSGGALLNNSGAWGYTMPYPGGSQAFSLQKNSTLTQSLYFPAGTYTISWSQEQRPGYAAEPYYFQLNGANQGSAYTAGTTSWTAAAASFTIPAAGNYAIGFLGNATTDGSVGLDNIVLSGGGAGSAQLPALTAVNITAAGAAFDLNGGSQTVGSLAGVAGASVLNVGQLTVGGDNTNTLFAGTINGSGNLIKVGTGTLTLTGTSTYVGTTSINQGTVAVTNVSGAVTSLGDPFNGQHHDQHGQRRPRHAAVRRRQRQLPANNQPAGARHDRRLRHVRRRYLLPERFPQFGDGHGPGPDPHGHRALRAAKSARP